MRPFLLLAAAGAVLGAAHTDVHLPTTKQALDDARRFQMSWQAQWKASELAHHARDLCGSRGCPPRIAQAMAALHCHRSFTELTPQRNATPAAIARSLYFIPPERYLPSRRSGFAVCPGWAPSTADSERVTSIDDVLLPELRARVRAQRDSVLVALEAALRLDPTSDALTGQLVRFSLDQGGASRATRALGACRASAWWCTALTALVAYEGDSITRADALFASAMSAAPDSVRCAWNDLGALLDTIARRPYSRLTCVARDSANIGIWWLSDPLYLTHGNERRTAHYARVMSLALRSALGRDERFDWQQSRGNDARQEMVTRFGWPTLTHWGGEEQDVEHTNYLRRLGNSPENGPYTTYEYSSNNRVHLVPDAAALAAPFKARDVSWELTARQAPGDSQWWPREHLKLSTPMVQLGAPQVAILRRHNHSILAAAVQLPSEDAGYRDSERVTGVALVASPQPDSAIVVAQRTGLAGSTLSVYGNVVFARAIVGIEWAGRASRAAGRVRFGQEMPPSLATFNPGETAISQPLLLSRLADGARPSIDSILSAMAATATVSRTQPFAVYWETYGYQASDTLEIAISVERHTRQSLLRKVATELNLVEDENTPVVVHWTAVPGAPQGLVVDGPVRVTGRQLQIDASRLPPGTYWLEVAARTSGTPPVRARKEIVVQ